MSSDEPSTQSWETIVPPQRVDVVVVQVQVAYHSQLYSHSFREELQCVKENVRNSFQAIAELRGGKLSYWEEDGGAFLFLVNGGAGCDHCCWAAVQMLEMLPPLNQDIKSSTGIENAAEVRLSCDAGAIIYETEPSHRPGDFVGRLMKHERQISDANRVAITGRVHRQLSQQFKSRFINWKYSAELESSLYATRPLPNTTDPSDPNLSRTPAMISQPPAQPDGATNASSAPPPMAKPSHGLPGRVGWWKAAAAALFLVLLAAFVIVQAAALYHSPAVPTVPAANTSAPMDEWAVWRKHVGDKLSTAKVTAEDLVEVVRRRPTAPHDPPAAVLRHDQAVADVLMNLEGVRSVFRKRLGIDEQFLGTGMSKPVSALDYGSATVHEYLIPNLSEEDSRVWARKLKLEGLDLEKTVKELIEENAGTDVEKQDLKKVIIAQALADDKPAPLPPVIRFAILDRKKYSGKMGRNDAVRVFASNLNEVWNLKVSEAANRSGYTFRGGDTFFVWVFLPRHGDEVVPATWGEVLDHLPEWMKEAESNSP